MINLAMLIGTFFFSTAGLLVASNWLPLGVIRAALILLLSPLFLYILNDRILTRMMKYILIGFVSSILFVFSLDLILSMSNNVATVPEWDFHLLWGYGLAAVNRVNPYESGTLYQLIQSINPSPELQSELFFFYPPPSLFIFLPLGYFDINQAYAVWYVIQVLFLGGFIYLMWKLFLPKLDILHILFISTLIMVYGPIKDTLMFGQTNIIMLFFLLLFWYKRNHWQGGIWLVIAIFVKPIAAVLLLYVVLKKRWSIVISMAITGMIISLFTILVFGSSTFFAYFLDNSIVNDLPAYLYREDINQSLLGAILRWTNLDLTQQSPYSPLYIIIAILLASITSLVILFVDEERENWILCLCLTLILLIYPKTLTHYGIILIIPILLLFAWHRKVPLQWFTIPITVALIFNLRFQNSHYFISFLLSYIIVHGLVIYWILEDRTNRFSIPMRRS